ncbi:hypothetical protein [Methylobacterium sp. SD21]|uniref:hypothetical protein n=1 Tax=Methylobacterium litchii TaxID=3138810 RepID=UPI00313D28E6
MPELFDLTMPIDGHEFVWATRRRNILALDLARFGRHWALTHMRADGHRPYGFEIRSAADTLVGLVVHCRRDRRGDGGPGDVTTSRDWIVLPARGPTPKRVTRGSHFAVWRCALLYAQAPMLEARRIREAARREEARRPWPMDPFDAEAMDGLTPAVP